MFEYMRGSGGEGRASGCTPLKNHKNIGFQSNTGPEPLKNHKATKPTFSCLSSSARQRNAIESGPMMARFYWYLDPISPHQLKKIKIKKKYTFSELDPL